MNFVKGGTYFDSIELEENIFNKCFTIKASTDNFNLPDRSKAFQSLKWNLEEMQELKTKLNQEKSLLNDLDLVKWHNHTKAMNLSSQIINSVKDNFNPEFCSQAWCKFFECLSKYDIISFIKNNNNFSEDDYSLNTIHLCEAPGAFIASLNHHLKINYPNLKWNWKATTLNPYYEGNSLSEMINEDRLIINSIENWNFFEDNTGNLISQENILSLTNWKIENLNKVHLITADGSIDCFFDPAEQEKHVSNLHFAEIIAALKLLDIGGCFVLKLFTFFESSTISYLYLLSCLFDHVELFKPATSKEGNSEIYLICKNLLIELDESYKDILLLAASNWNDLKALFSLECIDKSFISNLISISNYLVKYQASVIQRNLISFQQSSFLYQFLILNQNQIAENWAKIYNLRPIQPNDYIFNGNYSIKDKQYFKHSDFRKNEGTFTDSFKFNNSNNEIFSTLKIIKSEILKISSKKLKYSFASIQKKDFEIKLLLGKPFQNIKSSRFCISKLLSYCENLKVLLKDYIVKNTCKENICQDHIKLPNEIKDSTQIICFSRNLENFINCSDFDFTKNSLKKINCALNSLNQDDTIYLCNFPLLSRIMVGILYLLTQNFEQVTLKLKPCGILLQNYKPELKLSIQEFFTKIINQMDNDKRVPLEIYPINEICDKENFQHIFLYNMEQTKFSLLNYIEEGLI